jgi:hypothetical protein
MFAEPHDEQIIPVPAAFVAPWLGGAENAPASICSTSSLTEGIDFGSANTSVP